MEIENIFAIITGIEIIFAIITGIVAIVCISAGTRRQYMHYIKRNSENFEEVVGYVSDYDVDTDSDTNTYTAIIEYEVNSVKYTIRSNHSNSWKPKLGKEVTIKYNPENPEEAIFKNDYSGLIIAIVGIVFLIVAIYAYINNLHVVD